MIRRMVKGLTFLWLKDHLAGSVELLSAAAEGTAPLVKGVVAAPPTMPNTKLGAWTAQQKTVRNSWDSQ